MAGIKSSLRDLADDARSGSRSRRTRRANVCAFARKPGVAWNAAPGAQEVIGEVEQLVCAPPEGHAEGLDNVRARAISLSSDPTERENKQR